MIALRYANLQLLWARLPFRFVSRFVSFLNLLVPLRRHEVIRKENAFMDFASTIVTVKGGPIEHNCSKNF